MKNFTFLDVSQNYYSSDQLKQISSTRIGIAGAGGLGSNCAHILVRCGFENFCIADFDVVSVSNLNRQLYQPSHLGKSKVQCLKNVLTQVNPSVKMDIFTAKVNKDNIHEIFDNCDVLVEAFDNPECKSMLMEEFWDSGKLVVAVSGIGGFGRSDFITTKKVRENLYLIGDGKSEVGDTIKPYAPSVTVAAAKQADVILNWVLQKCQ